MTRHRYGAPAVAALIALLLLWTAVAAAGVEKSEGGYRFSYTDAAAKAVLLAGAFNGWSTTATPMTRDGDTWSAVIPLQPGKHEYKFVVDGQWTADPDNPMTSGAYGNSLVTILADGSIASAGPAAFNTRYSPKILIGGRFIGLYQANENAATGDRVELRRPELDIDLNFDVRVSDFLDARLLTKIRNEQENVELWQTHLLFDRGAIRLHAPAGDLEIFENEGITTFDDPLHLVGDVGIYHHAFGYGLQGARAHGTLAGNRIELLYTDNFSIGGTSFPSFEPGEEIVDTVVFDPVDGRYEFVPFEGGVSSIFVTNSNEDVAALRVTRDLGGLRLGLTGRYDRGYNPGSLLYFRGGRPLSDTLAAAEVYYRTTDEWQAGGFDAAYEPAPGWSLAGELLAGRSRIRGESGQELRFGLSTVVSGGDTLIGISDAGVENIGGRALTLDESVRFFLGATRGGEESRLRLAASASYEGHDYEPIGTDAGKRLQNRAWRYKTDARMRLGGRFGAEWNAGVGLDVTDFTYDRDTPFEAQLWFDDFNFWLDNGEHVVSIDRIVMLGGNDLVSWRPHLGASLLADRLRLDYDGILNAVSADTKPKYAETRLRGRFDLTEKVRAGLDARLVRYDDPVLHLDESFHDFFADIGYRFTDNIEVSLGYGVDPWVIDTVVNEFADIGRDYFLYSRGLTAAKARDDFLGLEQAIPAAEQALEDERRVQVEAIVRF